ncbi:thioredoxin family protein [Hydrogenimonas sp.]
MRAVKRLWALLLPLGLLAQSVGWRGDYDKARQEACRRGVSMVVVLVKRNCAPCGALLADLARKEELANMLKKRSVPVVVTWENEDYPIEMLYSRTFPTLFILSCEERFLAEPMGGGQAPSGLLRWFEKEASDER